MSLKVFSPQGNPRVNKLIVAAKLANVKAEHVVIPYDSLKNDENLLRHPLGKVPSAQTEDGFLFESNAILRHIARMNKQSGLYGNSLYQEALVD